MHPKTKERTVNITDISPTIKPKHIGIVSGADGEELSIAWEDGHTTKYSMKVLVLFVMQIYFRYEGVISLIS